MNAQDDNEGRRPIRRALVSVSDKSGLVDLGAGAYVLTVVAPVAPGSSHDVIVALDA